MKEIIWLAKSCSGRKQHHGDISITKVKKGFSIRIRSELAEEMTETGYIRIGVARHDQNLLYFMAADSDHGWKLSMPTTKDSTCSLRITTEETFDTLGKFVGDYNLEISDDNLFFVNRRNLI